MRREIFLVADHSKRGKFSHDEAGLLARLESDERYLRAQHPGIEHEAWRFLARATKDSPRKGIASETYERLVELQQALSDPSTPTWRAAQAGISYQNMVMIYRQPDNARDRGRIVGKDGIESKRALADACSDWLSNWLEGRGWAVEDLKVRGTDAAARQRQNEAWEAFSTRFKSLATKARFRAAREALGKGQ